MGCGLSRQNNSIEALPQKQQEPVESASTRDLTEGVKDVSNDKDEKVALDAVKTRGRRSSVSAECMSLSSQQKQPQVVKQKIPKSDEEYERIRKSVDDNFMFKGVSEADLREMFDVMLEKKVQESEVVIEQGDEGDFFYVVDKGEFDVFVDDNPEPVCHYSAGQTFGELALMYNSPRAATVKACTDGVLWALDRDTFRFILLSKNKAEKDGYEVVLKKMELLKSLSASQYAKIADALVPVEYPKGMTIIKQGDDDVESFFFHIITEGTCSFEYEKDGIKTIVGSATAGEYFGEKGLIGAHKRALSVIANTHTKCVVMDNATFERLMGPLQEMFHDRIDQYEDVEKLLRQDCTAHQ